MGVGILRPKAQKILVDQSAPKSPKNAKTTYRGATIDVWWLSDDGGLTLLVPYLLSQSRSYLQGARLRIFTVAPEGTSISSEEMHMASLLQKFRIQYAHLHVVASNSPTKEDEEQFYKSLEPLTGYNEGMVTESELDKMRNKTARLIATGALLRDYSSEADLVVV
ncbi:hypothetical protein OESDEN_14924 [Oesophagostomum dentatum]|uniref:SLC12A transporter C-terminal domain-containing protein n=1 Tax=Oesophagostomum dentatum TaxID=61180 RepID=A0A0B1SJ37_OESDE|nr:hypothetical protein OESDEN_14924 [Oesophagostomum dentatum]